MINHNNQEISSLAQNGGGVKFVYQNEVEIYPSAPEPYHVTITSNMNEETVYLNGVASGTVSGNKFEFDTVEENVTVSIACTKQPTTSTTLTETKEETEENPTPIYITVCTLDGEDSSFVEISTSNSIVKYAIPYENYTKTLNNPTRVIKKGVYRTRTTSYSPPLEKTINRENPNITMNYITSSSDAYKESIIKTGEWESDSISYNTVTPTIIGSTPGKCIIFRSISIGDHVNLRGTITANISIISNCANTSDHTQAEFSFLNGSKVLHFTYK